MVTKYYMANAVCKSLRGKLPISGMSEKNKLLWTFQTHLSAHEHAVLFFLVLYIQDKP